MPELIASTPALPAPPAAKLLRWYDHHRRAMPWRALPGQVADPYHVWLSEIMLQQTTVAAVAPYFTRFLERFPTVQALACAESSAVMQAWAGLGYYARARNLHACAKQVMALGAFPRDRAGLLNLPGIGPYTASAVAAIAFNEPCVPVDGNVERVTSRLFAVEQALPKSRPILAALAAHVGDQAAARARPSDFAQALFDLGATICTPRTPACVVCPWREECLARQKGIAAELPRKTPKAARPVRYGVHYWLTDWQGLVVLRQRPEKGLFGGMVELPGTEWRGTDWTPAQAIAAAPVAAEWRHRGDVRHVLSHFELRLAVYAASVQRLPTMDGFTCAISDVMEQALPSVMRRCVELACAE